MKIMKNKVLIVLGVFVVVVVLAFAAVPYFESVGRSQKAEEFKGLTVDAAKAKAKEEGIEARVVQIDGEPQSVLSDLRPDRLNFVVQDGKVTGAYYDKQ